MRSAGKLGCCNMALWDFLVIALLSGMSVKELYELHTFYAILIGCACGAAMLLLMRARFLGALLQIVCGLLWSQAIWRVGIYFHPTQDPVWIWGMQIVLAVVCIAVHFASVNALLGAKEDYRYEEADAGEAWQRYTAVDLGEDTEGISERFEELREAYLDACDQRDEAMEQAQELLEWDGTDTLYRLMRENDRIWTEGTARMSVFLDMLCGAETYQEQKSAMKRAEKLLSQMERITWEITKESNHVLKDIRAQKYVRQEEEEAEEEWDEAEAFEEEPEEDFGETCEKETRGKRDAEIDESLFAGCRDKEGLTRRYRSLMKTFHPDNGDGDTDMTIKVRKTYEHLLGRYR